MADQNEARIYGMADQANRPPPPTQGMRGEKATARPGDPDLSHPVTLRDGRTVTVSEGSGVAFTEATGRAGSAAHAETESRAAAAPRRRSKVPLVLAGLAAGIAGGAWLARRLVSRQAAKNWPLDRGDDPLPLPRGRVVVIRRMPRVSLRVSRI